jgi:hypothetical protein
MTKTLSFLVLGAARSGTTVLAEAINAHPEAICGMESFQAADDHSAISFPTSFVERLALLSGYQRDVLGDLLKQKTGQTLLAVGNKQPEYDLGLAEILRENPSLRLLLIYRDPQHFMDSWNRRARNVQDPAWHGGRTGLFGVLSLIGYMRALCRLPNDCLVVPYGGFSADIAGTMPGVFAHLGVAENGARREELQNLQRQSDLLKAKARPVLPNESDFLESIRYHELNALMGRPAAFLFSRVRANVQSYLRSLEADFAGKFISALCDYDEVAAIEYLRQMLKKAPVKEMFQAEAKHSPVLRERLKAISRHRKLQRIFLGADEVQTSIDFLAEIKAQKRAACGG